MSWFIYAVLGFGVLLFVLLWPRIRFSGEFSPDEKTFCVSGYWFRLLFCDKLHRFSLKLFSFDLHSGGQQEQPRTTDLFDEPPEMPSHDERSIHQRKTDSTRANVIEDRRRPEKKRKTVQSDTPKLQSVRKSTEYFRRYWGYRQLVKTLLTRAVRLLVRMVRAMRIDYLRSQVTVASSNAALTGMAYGALSPLLIFNQIKQVEFDLAADFKQSSSRVELAGAASCRPLVILMITTTWLTTLPWRRLVKLYFAERRRKKSVDATG